MVASSENKATLKFLCSYGGKILPRYPDGKLRYLGGHTRLLSLPRSIPFSELLVKLEQLCGAPVTHLRCQLPTEDLDALVSITSDEDLANLIEEYDRVSSFKIRAFLFSSNLSKSSSSSSTSSSSSSSSTSSFHGPTVGGGSGGGGGGGGYGFVSSPRFTAVPPVALDRCINQISTPKGTRKYVPLPYYYGYRVQGNPGVGVVYNANHWQ